MSLYINSHGKFRRLCTVYTNMPRISESGRVIATRSAVSLSSLGLRSSTPGPSTDFAPPAEPAATKRKVDEAPLWSMTPAAAAPVAGWQQWDGHDLPLTSSYDFRGFHRALLNCSYFMDEVQRLE